MKLFNKKKARVVVKNLVGKEEYERMKGILNAALNDQDGQPLRYGIPEESDVQEKIYYVIGKSGEVYEQLEDTLNEVFDDIGLA